ncbi:MAG: glycosyltransferase family 9 protein [Candidatus Hydrothermales bacterium]
MLHFTNTFKPIRKIFFFRWEGLGDLILDTPLFRIIKENLKDTELTVITSPKNREILFYNPFVDYVLPKKSLLELLFKKCDLFIDMMGNTRTFLLFLILRPPLRLGFQKKLPFLNLKIPFVATPEYTIKHRLKLLKILNIKNIPENPLPETYLSKMEEEKFKVKFKDIIKYDYVTIFPYAKGKVRDFNDKIYSYLNDRLTEKNIKVIFIFTQEGIKKFEKIRKLCKREPDYLYSPSLRELIFLLKYSKLYIGPDTGPRHIAISQNTKTLTFFTHTNPINWTPKGYENHRFFTPEIDCHPCETKNLNLCKRKDFKCLSLFDPEKIFETSIELLKK